MLNWESDHIIANTHSNYNNHISILRSSYEPEMKLRNCSSCCGHTLHDIWIEFRNCSDNERFFPSNYSYKSLIFYLIYRDIFSRSQRIYRC
jgi:hypothetical protein